MVLSMTTSSFREAQKTASLASFSSASPGPSVAATHKQTPLPISGEETRLVHALREAAVFANGVVAAEAWVIDIDGVHLVRPKGGWYRDPSFKPLDAKALRRLEEENHPDHVAPLPQLPGTGLAGTLWTGHQQHQQHKAPRMLIRAGRRTGEPNKAEHHPSSLFGLDNSSSLNWNATDITFSFQNEGKRNSFHLGDTSHHHHARSDGEPKDDIENQTSFSFPISSSNKQKQRFRRNDRNNEEHNPVILTESTGQPLFWRDILSLLLDPDSYSDPPTLRRLKLMHDAGFVKAAGIPFAVRQQQQKGIIMFLAPEHATAEVLNAPENVAFLQSAADLVGATVALSKSKTDLIDKQQKASSPTTCGTTIEKVNDITEGQHHHHWKNGFQRYLAKLRGGNLQPLPRMSTREALLAFVGSFATLLTLTLVSNGIHNTGSHYQIVLGPFGALMTLQYGLTMAPAAQPRNALYGQMVSLCIALAFSNVPPSLLPQWARVPLATATAIAAMLRLGVTHPPAGAAALIVASNDEGTMNWVVVPLMLLGNVIAVLMATLINNASPKRQYPAYLAFGIVPSFQAFLKKLLKRLVARQNTPAKEEDEKREKEIGQSDRAETIQESDG